jgi:hypothetical protein
MNKSSFSFNKLFLLNKPVKSNEDGKEKNIASNDSKNSENNKSIFLFNKNKKDRISNGQEEKNTYKKAVKDREGTNTEKTPDDFNNTKNIQESYQEFFKLTQVNSIYEKNNLDADGLNTIFIAETYLNTLPDYLPNELRRKAVLDIIRSSDMSSDIILKDGEKRKTSLINFMIKFTQTTEKIIKDYEDEINKLTKSIQACERAIATRKNLHQEQSALVKYEIHRLQRIMDFLRNENQDENV